tara:strand:- start:3630 stop:4958 length:1329 start_codon:yes stop_codon:yes gene_type:complete
MNTYTFSISTTRPDIDETYDTIHLFDQTNFTIDMSDVYASVFPNYIAFNWGDGSPIQEPDIKIFRNYKTESIYPEILRGDSPVFLNTDYSHIYYPSTFALKKSMTLRVNIGYVTGEVTKLTVPVIVRAESYYDTIGDMEIAGIDLLNDENNSSRYTFLTKKDNHLIQTDNSTQKAEQVFADRIPSAEGSEAFFPPRRRRARRGPRARASQRPPGKPGRTQAGATTTPLPPLTPEQEDLFKPIPPRTYPTPGKPKDWEAGGKGGWGLPGPGKLIPVPPPGMKDWWDAGKNPPWSIPPAGDDCPDFLPADQWAWRRNGGRNPRGAVLLGDFKDNPERSKNMTYPPYYLYLNHLADRGIITNEKRDECLRKVEMKPLRYGDLFEQGFGLDRKGPDLEDREEEGQRAREEGERLREKRKQLEKEIPQNWPEGVRQQMIELRLRELP